MLAYTHRLAKPSNPWRSSCRHIVAPDERYAPSSIAKLSRTLPRCRYGLIFLHSGTQLSPLHIDGTR